MANTGGDKRPTLVLGELVFVGGVQGSVLFGEVVSYPDEFIRGLVVASASEDRKRQT
jgi:hypothetical protein